MRPLSLSAQAAHCVGQRLSLIHISIPIFLGIMLLVFWLTFGVVGSTLSDLFAAGISLVTNLADEALTLSLIHIFMLKR